MGAGSIGLAWAIVFARSGWQVGLYEPDHSRRATAVSDLMRRLEALADEGLLAEEPEQVASRIRQYGQLQVALEGSDYVQECVPEDLELKRMVFAQLDHVVGERVPIASSSSAILCSAMAKDIEGRKRCLVAHPGNPPYLLPLVELVPAPFTEPAIVDRAAAVLEQVGMAPVYLNREIEGFVFNRLQAALLREGYALVRDGVATPEVIDRVVREGLGRRWAVLGPFETVELNTRGGIEAHAARLGPAYARMAAAPGRSDPWEPELVAAVASDVGRRLPRAAWEEYVLRRDRALMVLERCRREHAALAMFEPGSAVASSTIVGMDPAGGTTTHETRNTT